jgi:hypothetical protein
MSTPSYYINSVSANTCGSIVVPGDVVFVSWNIAGNPSYDSCYASIRPISDLSDNGAVVADAYPHPQCFGSSTNIVIPQTPKNASFQYDGSLFIARVNTGDGIHSDSCTFRYDACPKPQCNVLNLFVGSIMNQCPKSPPSPALTTAIVSISVTTLGLIPSMAVALYVSKKTKKAAYELEVWKQAREQNGEV